MKVQKIKSLICCCLVATMLFTFAGCKKKSQVDNTSSEAVEVIYEYEDDSEVVIADGETESNTSTASQKQTSKKKTAQNNNANTSVSQQTATSGAQQNTPAQAQTVSGKNSRPYLGSATVAGGKIDVNDGHLYFSPYNWYNGGSYRLNTVCGGYVKIAFTGNYLALGVDDSKIGSTNRSEFIIHAYIDSLRDSAACKTFTLENVSDGKILLADNLSEGVHYATVYFSHSSTADAWNNGAPNSLRINGFYITPGQQIVDLADTPNKVHPKRIIVYGDSITEGYGVDEGGEFCYAAILGDLLDAEYGQLGNGGMGWLRGGARLLDIFYHDDDKSGYWKYYFAGASRFVGDNIASGYIDGEPDAFFVNMGINDANTPDEYEREIIQKYITAFFADARTAVGPNTPVFFIMPYNIGKDTPDMKRYKNTFTKGINEYIAASNDANTHLIDFSKDAYRIVHQNSKDDIHPNKTGSKRLANEIFNLIKDFIK